MNSIWNIISTIWGSNVSEEFQIKYLSNYDWEISLSNGYRLDVEYVWSNDDRLEYILDLFDPNGNEVESLGCSDDGVVKTWSDVLRIAKNVDEQIINDDILP